MGRPLIYTHSGDTPNLARSVLKIKQALSNNQLVSAIDVNPTWVNDAVSVSFLGRRCRLTSSLVRLAYDCQCPIIPYFNLRHSRSWFRHRLEVLPELELSGHLLSDVQCCADQLQTAIQGDLAQWFSWDSLGQYSDGSEISGLTLDVVDHSGCWLAFRGSDRQPRALATGEASASPLPHGRGSVSKPGSRFAVLSFPRNQKPSEPTACPAGRPAGVERGTNLGCHV